MALKTTALDNMAKNIDKRVSAVVRKTAFDVQSDAQQRAARDTGAMANSIYTKAEGINGYDAAKAAVQALNPKTEVFDDLELDAVPGVTQAGIVAFVAVMVMYGLFVEFGTHKQQAKPYLYPAASAAEGSFVAAMSQAVKESVTAQSVITTSL